MRTIDVGIGHDDDALVAQIFLAILRARAAAQCLDHAANHEAGEIRGNQAKPGAGQGQPQSAMQYRFAPVAVSQRPDDALCQRKDQAEYAQ